MLFLGSNRGGASVSPSISRRSISTVRHICEIGTSFAPPSNGFSVLSPTRSSEVYIHEISTLKGMTSQTMFPLITPSTLSLSLSNSLSNPNGSRRQNNLMKKELTVAYCLGYGKSLMRSHLPCCRRNSLIEEPFDRLALKAHELRCSAAGGKDLFSLRITLLIVPQARLRVHSRNSESLYDLPMCMSARPYRSGAERPVSC
jgi:hypothetical protein